MDKYLIEINSKLLDIKTINELYPYKWLLLGDVTFDGNNILTATVLLEGDMLTIAEMIDRIEGSVIYHFEYPDDVEFLVKEETDVLPIEEIDKMFPHTSLCIERIEFKESGHLLTAKVHYRGSSSAASLKQIQMNDFVVEHYTTPDDDTEVFFTGYNSYGGRVE